MKILFKLPNSICASYKMFFLGFVVFISYLLETGGAFNITSTNNSELLNSTNTPLLASTDIIMEERKSIVSISNILNQASASIVAPTQGYVRQRCSEHNVYRYLRKCKEECNGTFNSADEKPNTGKPNKFTYKLVILQKDEYSLSTDGLVLTEINNKMTFTSKHFTKGKDGRVYICVPMDEAFLKCVRWPLDPNEYEIHAKQKRIWVPSHKKHYEATEHVFRPQDNHTLICSSDNSWKRKALLTAWFLSLICLGATIILGCTFPQLNLKRNKILLCNLTMLFLAYLTLCIKLLVTNKSPGACKFLAHLQQYFFLSAFCWINIQAVDVFLRFFNIRLHSMETVAEKKRFIIYAIHGWATPFWITIITVIVEVAEVEYLNPMIGSDICWFQPNHIAEAFLYFYAPISIVLLVNTILFIITIYKLCGVGKGTNSLKKKMQKQLFKVYLKLIVVMGLCWIMEVLSVAIGGDPEIWIFTDMINALQGLFIFIVYVCKPSFLKKCFNKCCRHPGCPSWWPLKPITDSSTYRVGETTASTTNNSTLGRDISLVSTGDKL